MSLKQVVPPRSISAMARRVPARTNASSTNFASAGQMCSASHDVERQVVGEAPEQGHRGVGMGVDEPRHQCVPVEVHALAGGEPARRSRPRGRARRWRRPAPRARGPRGRTRPARPGRPTKRSARDPPIPRFPWGNSSPPHPSGCRPGTVRPPAPALRLPPRTGKSAAQERDGAGRVATIDTQAQGVRQSSRPRAGPFCSGLHDPRKKGPAPRPAAPGHGSVGCHPSLATKHARQARPLGVRGPRRRSAGRIECAPSMRR